MKNESLFCWDNQSPTWNAKRSDSNRLRHGSVSDATAIIENNLKLPPDEKLGGLPSIIQYEQDSMNYLAHIAIQVTRG